MLPIYFNAERLVYAGRLCVQCFMLIHVLHVLHDRWEAASQPALPICCFCDFWAANVPG